MPDHSDDDLASALGHVAYELWMMAEAASRIRSGALNADPVAANAYLESMLLHARATADFFVLSRGYPSDIRRTDFTEDWEPAPTEAADRIRASAKLMDKHLAHLTWERLGDATPSWDFSNIADDVLAVADQWSINLSISNPVLYSAFRPQLYWAMNVLAEPRAPGV